MTSRGRVSVSFVMVCCALAFCVRWYASYTGIDSSGAEIEFDNPKVEATYYGIYSRGKAKFALGEFGSGFVSDSVQPRNTFGMHWRTSKDLFFMCESSEDDVIPWVKYRMRLLKNGLQLQLVGEQSRGQSIISEGIYRRISRAPTVSLEP